MGWEDALERFVAMGWVKPPEEAARPDQPINWKAELLREANFGHEDQDVEAEDQPGGLPALPKLVRPHLDLPPAVFRKHGYEPGFKPPGPMAAQELVQLVYGRCLEPMLQHMVADTPLFGALDSWDVRTPQRNHVLMRILFERISHHMGEAYGFVPAPLGRVDHNKLVAGAYHFAEQKISLGAAHLGDHVRETVNTIAHEQTHRLQDLLVQALTYRGRNLSPPERSLARWWYDEPVADHRKQQAAYRNSLREWHARLIGDGVAAGLGRVMGW